MTDLAKSSATRSVSADADVRAVDVRASFRHSAGKLGSVFLSALRDKRLLGWRSGTPARVTVPPKDLGVAGEWIEIGPGARLETYAPRDWYADSDDDSCLALVTIDGADAALLTRLRPPTAAGALPIGTRLTVRFAAERHGAITDFWFEPAKA